MSLGTDLIVSNLHISISEWIVIVYFIACVMFAAKDFKMTLIAWFIGNAGLFIWFYNQGLNWTLPLTIFLTAFVLMLLIIIPVSNTSPTGGLV